ncbi:MAG: aminotransferase class I/II-fold pyridoxal phosphate-dependent enzyme [Nostocoides sp.]
MEPILGASLDDLRATRTSVKWRAFDPDVLPVWVAEMDSRPCPAVVDAVTAAIGRGDTGYTWIEPYAEAFSAFARDRWGWTVDPTALEGTPDVMIGVRDLLDVLTSPGEAVVVSPPVYNGFYLFIDAYRRRVVEAPLSPDGRLDEAALATAFGAATAGGGRAAYLLANPHNPVGTVHTREELAMLAAVADAHGVRVISDEIHAPLVYPGSPFVPYAAVPGGEGGITLFSASKAFNLAGLKCGLAMAGPAAVADLRRVPEVARHGASHVGAIAQAAALEHGRAWLDQVLTELDANRRHLGERLAAELPEVGYRMPDSTYLAWLDFSATGLGDDPSVPLREHGRVALSRGLDFGPPGRAHARLNFATSPVVLDEAIDRIVATVRG